MDLEFFASPNHFEENEATPTTMVEAQPNVPEEPSPSKVVVEGLSELTPWEEVTESKSGDRGESNKALNFFVEGNKGQDLPTNKLIE